MASTVAGGQGGWKTFTSSTAFSVAYPATWRPIGGSTDRLDILSSTDFAKGVVIARGEAEIIVIELRDSTGASLPQLIDRDLQGDSVLSRRDLPGAAGDTSGCRALTEIVSTWEVGPRAHEIDTVFYCLLHGRIFTTTLRNWPEDTQQVEYQRVALQVTRSLRSSR
jgi:hypothetical protein